MSIANGPADGAGEADGTGVGTGVGAGLTVTVAAGVGLARTAEPGPAEPMGTAIAAAARASQSGASMPVGTKARTRIARPTNQARRRAAVRDRVGMWGSGDGSTGAAHLGAPPRGQDDLEPSDDTSAPDAWCARKPDAAAPPARPRVGSFGALSLIHI